MRQLIAPIQAAFQFLTRFPVKAELDFTPELLRDSTRHYPLVGAAIGISTCAAALLAAWVLPPLPAAVVSLIVWVWLTGGLHLDGWMDCADALLSYRPRDKMLEIMKDSRVGAMAVLACVLLLMLKAALLYSLITAGHLAISCALLTVPVWSRWFMTYAISKWPSAREGEGLAAQFGAMNASNAQSAAVSAIFITFLGMSIPLLIFGVNIGLPAASYGIYFFAAPLLTLVAGIYAGGRVNKKLGGLTGDVYGALNEGLEALLLLAAVILFL